MAYAAARQYYEVHGNLNVPIAYVAPNGVALGKWVARMRYARSNPSKSNVVLNAERIEKLDAMGIVWEKPDSWQHRFELAAEYLKVNGNLQIPAKYKSEDGIWLGTWLYRQRVLLREQSPKLSKEQTDKLQELLNMG